MSSHRSSRPGTRSQPVKATQPFSLQTTTNSASASGPTSPPAVGSTSASVPSSVTIPPGGTPTSSWQPSQHRSPLSSSNAPFPTMPGWRGSASPDGRSRSHSPGSPGAKGFRLRRHGSPGTSPAPSSRAGPWDHCVNPVALAASSSPFTSIASGNIGKVDDVTEQRPPSANYHRPGSVEIEITEKHAVLERQSSGSHPPSPSCRLSWRSSGSMSVDSDLNTELETFCNIIDDMSGDDKMFLPTDQEIGRREPVADLLLSRRSTASNTSQSSDSGQQPVAGQASPAVAFLHFLSGSPQSMLFDWSPPDHLPRLETSQPTSDSQAGQLQGPDKSKVKMIFARHGTAFRQCVPGVGSTVARQPSPVVVGNGVA